MPGLQDAVLDLVSLKTLACLVAEDDAVKDHGCSVALLLGRFQEGDGHLCFAATSGAIKDLRAMALRKTLSQFVQRLLLVWAKNHVKHV